MTAARAWRQHHNDFEGGTGQSDPHPRSLTAMLANPRQALPPEVSHVVEVRQEGELEGVSELVALNEDLAPVFQAAAPLSQARRAGSRDSSSRELLADLFPSGSTSGTLSPSEAVVATAAAAAARGDQPEPSSINASLGEKEPELKGRHIWACLASAATPFAAAASSTRENGGSGGGEEGEEEPHPSTDNPNDMQRQQPPHFHPSRGPSHQLHSWSELQQSNHYGSDGGMGKIGERDAATAVESDEIGRPREKRAITATRRVEYQADDHHHDGDRIARRDNIPVPNGSGQGVGNRADTVEVRGRENELKSALDHLVPRLLESEERVKVLEESLEQAKLAESGRNALIKQVNKLEEEVKHSRHMLDKRHAEALEWREKRQLLEADNCRLCAELRSALGQNTRFETENRRKDALLVENNSMLEAELRHKDQLLVEAERDKKRAWQTTNESAETAKAAMVRTDAAAKEASDLRSLRNGTPQQNAIRSEKGTVSFASQRRSNANRGQSLLDVLAGASASASASSTAAEGGSGGVGPESTSRSWEPTESDRFSGVLLTGQYDGRHRTASFSPGRERSVDHDLMPHPNAPASRTQNELGQRPKTGLREGYSGQSKELSIVVPPQANAVATNEASPKDVFIDKRGKEIDPWWNGGVLSPSKETQEVPTGANPTASGLGQRIRAADAPPSAVRAQGREHCHDGDRQRHDSEGVKGALTGATPAWTDAPTRLGGRSPTDTYGYGGGGSDGYGGSSGNESSFGFLRRDCLGAGRPTKDYQIHEEIHVRDEKSRDPGKIYSGYHQDIDREAKLWSEERTKSGGTSNNPTADGLSAVPRGLQLFEAPPQRYPAAGHRRGRDLMSSRRSSLSGAGVGVTETVGEANETSRIDPASSGPQLSHANLTKGGLPDTRDLNGDDFDERQRTGVSAVENHRPPPFAAAPVCLEAISGRSSTDGSKPPLPADRRSSEPHPSRPIEEGTAAMSSAAPNQRTVSFASMLGSRNSPGTSDKDPSTRRERVASAPFATDAAEDELRPVREVERRLMLLQMETSQLEAEQSKLLPKARKTMQARAQMQKIDSRLALLASEASGLRRVLREKPWRM